MLGISINILALVVRICSQPSEGLDCSKCKGRLADHTFIISILKDIYDDYFDDTRVYRILRYYTVF